jgi:hypothetical protein
MMLAGAVYVPIAPLVLLAFAGRLLWRLSREEQEAVVSDERAPAAA